MLVIFATIFLWREFNFDIHFTFSCFSWFFLQVTNGHSIIHFLSSHQIHQVIISLWKVGMASTNLFILTFILIRMTLINTCSPIKPTAQPKFPAIIIFGDSTVDTGNNNYISTLFKANKPPYGKNFPGHLPTGRFSDGLLVPDFVASFLGIKEAVPPFLDPKLSEDELCTGVSFASAGSGYDDLITKLFNVIPVSKQIQLFKSYIVKLKGIVGEKEVKNIIGEALVIVSAGTNDLVFNFFDIPTRRCEFNISGYQHFLLQRLENFVKELYDLGCRKMVVAGLPPIGCLPIQMTAKFENPKDRKCLEDQNSIAQSFNKKLAKLLPQIQAMLPRSKIVYADVYDSLIDMINHPRRYGFAETKLGCCGTGLLEASFLCNPATPICGKPSEYLFWDSVHPTQEACRYLAKYLEKEVVPQFLDDHGYCFTESDTSEQLLA